MTSRAFAHGPSRIGGSTYDLCRLYGAPVSVQIQIFQGIGYGPWISVGIGALLKQVNFSHGEEGFVRVGIAPATQ